MGDPSDRYPTIRINALNAQDIFEITTIEAETAADRGTITRNSKRETRTLNCSPQEASNLITSLHHEAALIFSSYIQVERNFGVGKTIEFRIYRNIEGGLGQRLHVLDVN